MKIHRFGLLLLPGAALIAVASAPLAGALPRQGTGIVPQYSKESTQEPALVLDTPEAIITRVGDRVRDRHAREEQFHAYAHFLPLYWEKRTVGIEIVDRVAKGGKGITYNITSLAPLNQPNLRVFFLGKNTVAEYHANLIAQQVDPLHYTATITDNPIEHRPIQIGDRIEMEFSPFLLPPIEGRTNYYGTALLYVVGKGGMVPWEMHANGRDSFPLLDEALSGGGLTLSRPYSDEPKEQFKQLATNVAPANAQNFVLGRRLHHSDFGTGMHSEQGNPEYAEIKGKLGQHFVGRSCIACHVNNGRALPPAIGAPMTAYLVRVGSDAKGTPHPKLGATLQSQSSTSEPEAGITLSEWTETAGTYGDGSPFHLRKPVYKFTGVVPEFYSVRIAPPLVGQGLLEAIEETSVAALVAPKSGRVQVVRDVENGKIRLGRFGWKAGQATLLQQIAGALKNDMGVASDLYPELDRGSDQLERLPSGKLSRAELEKLAKYSALLGVTPRRALDDPAAQRGQALFRQIKCASCHAPLLKTGPYHPLAELQNQTIRPYTDLLLHDMGQGLADNLGEGTASGRDWRTAPLWGIGLTAAVSGGEAYLHDGRARTLEEAILWHGGEAETSRELFRKMSEAERAAIVTFLKGL